jgi:hypothetical protein
VVFTAMTDRLDLNAVEEEELERLATVTRFARMLRGLAWFSMLGQELDDDEREWARAYLDALGFPDAEIAVVEDWEEAEAAARNPDWNTAWWEAEEQLRAALVADACALAPEDEVMVALTTVTSRASEIVHEAATAAAGRSGVFDEALIRAAAGAATQACYQAALVLAAGAGDEHPFALKFRLYESGRWPLGVVGSTFNLF